MVVVKLLEIIGSQVIRDGIPTIQGANMSYHPGSSSWVAYLISSWLYLVWFHFHWVQYQTKSNTIVWPTKNQPCLQVHKEYVNRKTIVTSTLTINWKYFTYHLMIDKLKQNEELKKTESITAIQTSWALENWAHLVQMYIKPCSSRRWSYTVYTYVQRTVVQQINGREHSQTEHWFSIISQGVKSLLPCIHWIDFVQKKPLAP